MSKRLLAVTPTGAHVHIVADYDVESKQGLMLCGKIYEVEHLFESERRSLAIICPRCRKALKRYGKGAGLTE